MTRRETSAHLCGTSVGPKDTADPEPTRTIPIGLSRRPAAPFNSLLAESLRDSANNTLSYDFPTCRTPSRRSPWSKRRTLAAPATSATVRRPNRAPSLHPQRSGVSPSRPRSRSRSPRAIRTGRRERARFTTSSPSRCSTCGPRARTPPAGDGYLYLIRAKNDCGTETYGSGSGDPDPRAALGASGPCP